MSNLSVAARLDTIMGAQKKKDTPGWIGDAIYGVNDGLGAIFGIIAGVAGYTSDGSTIVISGLFGALASTLSMAAGAWLATKSENELMERGIRQAREDIRLHPERERETLTLLYQTKGFAPEHAEQMMEIVTANDEHFLNAVAQEKYGHHEESAGNPGSSALYGGVSTLVGGIVPLIPFFFLHGFVAVVAAAVVSLIAHFAVGAAKSLVTVRSWWASGLEMTVVGILVGVVSYGLGLIGAVLIK